MIFTRMGIIPFQTKRGSGWAMGHGGQVEAEEEPEAFLALFKAGEMVGTWSMGPPIGGWLTNLSD